MTQLEQENLRLKETIKELNSIKSRQEQIINSLNNIALSLTDFSDVSSVLKQMLKNIQDITNSDGGTIYLTDGKKLCFKHIVNKSLNISHYDCDENQEIWNYLDMKESNNNLVSVRCALTKRTIVVDDIYSSKEFDFDGTKEFDSKINYKSNTMLVVPMLLSDNTLVGVLQLINKVDINNNIIAYNKDDELIANALASQSSIILDKFRQEKLLIQQSKQAAMGEIIDVVAHQWKQPLNVINLVASQIEMYLDMKIKISKKLLRESSQDIFRQVKHLLTTLDEFRTFLRPNKKQDIVNIKSMINSVLLLLKDELSQYDISVTVKGCENLTVNVIENEFKHVLINLINNAKDAFTEKEILNKKIVLKIKESIDSNIIEIKDNAGGIPIDIIDSLFSANVTTKKEKGGTGIGLYMSTQIVQKYNGNLSVKNCEDGAVFSIKIHK